MDEAARIRPRVHEERRKGIRPPAGQNARRTPAGPARHSLPPESAKAISRPSRPHDFQPGKGSSDTGGGFGAKDSRARPLAIIFLKARRNARFRTGLHAAPDARRSGPVRGCVYRSGGRPMGGLRRVIFTSPQVPMSSSRPDEETPNAQAPQPGNEPAAATGERSRRPFEINVPPALARWSTVALAVVVLAFGLWTTFGPHAPEL